MKILKLQLLLVLCSAFAFSTEAAPVRSYRDYELSLIARLTTWILHRNHYRTLKLDNDF